MDKNRVKTIKYVLAEYQGLIVEVYTVHEWYPVDAVTKKGKYKQRWGFNGKVAEDSIRKKYINKSIKDAKGRLFVLEKEL